MNVLLENQELQTKEVFYSLDETRLEPNAVFRLDLSNRKLRHVPEEIRNLKNIQELILAKNPIRELPVWMDELNYLQKLDISDTKISLLKRIKNLPHLSEIKCKNSLINRIELNSFLRKHPDCSIEANPSLRKNPKLLLEVIKTLFIILMIMAATYGIMLAITPTSKDTWRFFLFFVLFIIAVVSTAVVINKIVIFIKTKVLKKANEQNFY